MGYSTTPGRSIARVSQVLRCIVFTEVAEESVSKLITLLSFGFNIVNMVYIWPLELEETKDICNPVNYLWFYWDLQWYQKPETYILAAWYRCLSQTVWLCPLSTGNHNLAVFITALKWVLHASLGICARAGCANALEGISEGKMVCLHCDCSAMWRHLSYGASYSCAAQGLSFSARLTLVPRTWIPISVFQLCWKILSLTAINDLLLASQLIKANLW